MRGLLFALCCATTTLTAQPSRALIGLPGYKDKFPIEDVTIPFTLDAPAARAFAAVRAAFADLKVPIDVNDTASRVVGRQNSTAQVTFAGYRMSRLFDCGMQTTGGPNADSYRLTIVFLALVDPVDDSHTRVRVGFVAGAVPAFGNKATAVQCGSTGVIEAKLIDAANARLK